MRNILIVLLGLLAGNPLFPQSVELKTGDLIFQESCGGDVGKAIKEVTESVGEYNFTHVGIVWIDGKDTVVIEATHPRVVLTPLHDYLHLKDETDCPPLSVVARLKSEHHKLIPAAIEEARKLVGKEYDYAFVLDNDKYYCSELIYDIFLKANGGTPVFRLNEMTFKSKDTGEFMPEWIAYYTKLNEPIPEGKQGINPGAMSRSASVYMVGEYSR